MSPRTSAAALILGLVLVGCATAQARPVAVYRAYEGPLEAVAGSEPVPVAAGRPRAFYEPVEPTPAPTAKPRARPTSRRGASAVQRTVRPSAAASHHAAGAATWYAYVPGGAAAGPALRAAIGPRWRGTRVTVCSGARCVSVVLSDWCACRPATRLVDLNSRSFAALGPLSRGLLPVTVSW